jgi:succinate-acetate transporter protein
MKLTHLWALLILGVALDQLTTVYGVSLGIKESNPFVVAIWPWGLMLDWVLTTLIILLSYYVQRGTRYWDTVMSGLIFGGGLIRLITGIWNIYLILRFH